MAEENITVQTTSRKLPELCTKQSGSDLNAIYDINKKSKNRKSNTAGSISNVTDKTLADSVTTPRSTKTLSARALPSLSTTPREQKTEYKPPSPSGASETSCDIEPSQDSTELRDTTPPRRAKRKNQTKSKVKTENVRKKSDDDIDNELPVRSNETSLDTATLDKPAKKKKKRKRPETQSQEAIIKNGVGLAYEIDDLTEDIVTTDTTPERNDGTAVGVGVMRSEPTNRVFIEKNSGFKSTNRAKLARRRAEQAERQNQPREPTTPLKSTIQFALSTHRVFKTISVFLQGLFSGITLWQIIASYMLLNQGSSVFLQYYYMLASPVQALYYFLFAFATVAAFDRYDVARPTRRCVQRSCGMQAGTIAALFYFIGLVFSVSMAFIDERIGLYVIDPTLWSDSQQTSLILFQWQVLNVIRGVTAILGWFVISLRPGTDRLMKNLEKADENILEAEEQFRDEIQEHQTGTVSGGV